MESMHIWLSLGKLSYSLYHEILVYSLYCCLYKVFVLIFLHTLNKWPTDKFHATEYITKVDLHPLDHDSKIWLQICWMVYINAHVKLAVMGNKTQISQI